MATRAALAYRQELARLDRAAFAQLLALWAAGNPDTFPAEAAPVVLAMQRRGVELTDAYLALVAGAATGTTTSPIGLDPDPYIGRHARRGAFVEEVYARPWHQFVRDAQDALGRSLSTGDAVDLFLRGDHPAVRAATARLEQTVATDLQLATRYAQVAQMTADRRIAGYRRVLGPGRNCGLCVVASTRRYHVAELQPIHPHCRCTVEPITQDIPAGTQVVDRDRLAAVNERIAGGNYTRSAYGKLRVDGDQLPSDVTGVEVIDQHPEIPGLLWDSGHRWEP